MRYTIALLIAAATYLTFRFQAKVNQQKRPRKLQIKKWKLSRKQSLQPQHTFAFLWAIKAELEAGVTAETALAQGISAVPKAFLTATRSALDAHSDFHSALKVDAIELNADEIFQLAEILEITAITGASIDTSISRLITTVRARQAQTQLIREELASTKTTMYVLAAIPILGLFIGAVAGLSPLSFLTGKPWGWACLGCALLLEGLGVVWIRILVKRATT